MSISSLSCSFPMQNLLEWENFGFLPFHFYTNQILHSSRLEPLLQRIKNKRDAVVCPIIDVINDENMAYMYSSDSQFQVGGFTWSGHFTWIPIPDFEKQRLSSSIDPTRLVNNWNSVLCETVYPRTHIWDLLFFSLSQVIVVKMKKGFLKYLCFLVGIILFISIVTIMNEYLLGPQLWLVDYSPSNESISGILVRMMPKWKYGVVKIWKCPFV